MVHELYIHTHCLIPFKLSVRSWKSESLTFTHTRTHPDVCVCVRFTISCEINARESRTIYAHTFPQFSKTLCHIAAKIWVLCTDDSFSVSFETDARGSRTIYCTRILSNFAADHGNPSPLHSISVSHEKDAPESRTIYCTRLLSTFQALAIEELRVIRVCI